MLEPGQIFAARYRVIRRIAEGGMGAIFEAEHTATERRVALKLLFPHIMSVASARKKFELEAKISARVNSPNIVEVLDAGFDEASKSPFLVMELLEGQTLAHYVRDRGALGIDQALPLLQQVAAGLDAAHGYRESNGTPKPIVHRDLKPENLFMAREHGVHMVKILDFGIAKVLGETGNISQEVRGTPLYMAFEQVTAGALSPQTDVWALGLIAYYMFTASHYWRSANAPSANVQSLFAEILTLPLEAPSVRLRQQNVNVELSPAFDSWLLECIQRDPARRFASAGAAIDALAQAFDKKPRARPRVDSKPAAGRAFASTEVYQPSGSTSPKPLGTAASLPGMSTERGSAAAPAATATSKPRGWVPAAAAGAAVVLASLGWLVLGGDDTKPGATSGDAPRAASAPPETSPVPATTTTPEPSPRGPSIAPARDTGAHVSPVSDPPTIAPAPEADRAEARDTDPGANADPASAESGSPPATTPQVRVAPRDETDLTGAAASNTAVNGAASTATGAMAAGSNGATNTPRPAADPSTPATSATSRPATADRGTSAAPTVRAPAPTPPAKAPIAAPKKPPRSSEAYKMR